MTLEFCGHVDITPPSGNCIGHSISPSGGQQGQGLPVQDLRHLLHDVWFRAHAAVAHLPSRKRWSTFAPYLKEALGFHDVHAVLAISEVLIEAHPQPEGRRTLIVGPAQKYRPSKSGAKIEVAKVGLPPISIDASLTRRITRTYAFEILGFSMANRDTVLTAITAETDADSQLRATDIAFLRLDPMWQAKHGH